MTRRRKTVLMASASLAILLAVAIGVAFYTLQTDWFKNQVRLRLIATIERASGGHVEIGKFSYDWRALTAGVDHFVLHGTEPANSPALFTADRLSVQLKLISVFRKKIDVASVIVERPHIFLLVRPDGSTNIPSPKIRTARTKTVPEQIVDLAIRHFELRQGWIAYQEQQWPLDLRGENLNADIRYDVLTPRYLGTLSSRQLHIKSGISLPAAADLETRFIFEKDRLNFEQLTLASSHSHLNITGSLDHFTHPELSLDVRGSLDAAEVGKLFKLPQISAGDFVLAGQGHYRNHLYDFAGSISGRHFAYHSGNFQIENVSLQSDVQVSPKGVQFQKLMANAAGSRITGKAELSRFTHFKMDGRIDGLAIRNGARFFTDRPLAWGGVASGPIQVEGQVDRTAKDFKIGAQLQIVPDAQGIAIKGFVDAAYNQREDTLRLASSHLEFPHSTLDASGTLSQHMDITFDTTDLSDLEPAIALATTGKPSSLPVVLRNGRAHFSGTVTGNLRHPEAAGALRVHNAELEGYSIDRLAANVTASESGIVASGIKLNGRSLDFEGSASLALSHWQASGISAVQLHGSVSRANLQGLAEEAKLKSLPPVTGQASATVVITGTLLQPVGSAHLKFEKVSAYGEQIDSVQTDLTFAGRRVSVDHGVLKKANATLSFRGAYQHVPDSWQSGGADLQVDSAGIALENLAVIRRYEPGLAGNLEIHARSVAAVGPSHVTLQSFNGTAHARDIALSGVPLGDMAMSVGTAGQTMQVQFTGNLRGSKMDGATRIELAAGNYDSEGNLHLSQMNLATLHDLIRPHAEEKLPFQGFVEGGFHFSGPLTKPNELRATLRIDQIQISPQTTGHPHNSYNVKDLTIHNIEPVVMDISQSVATVQSAKLVAKDTHLEAAGRIAFNAKSAMDLKVGGSVNLQILRIFDPSLVSSGTSRMTASITGPLNDPAVSGTLELQDASLYFEDLPNGLDHANGLIRFDRNRATITKLTAQSGGGNLAVTGFVSFGNGGPFIYRLETNADNVRVRYAGNISVTFNADLKLTGTSEKSLLSGSVTVTKAAFTPNTDVGSLFAASTTPSASPSSDSDFLNGVQLNLRVESAPSLQLTTSLSQDVQAEIDLRLRGNISRPAVLGRVSANEGQIQVFGNKYSINRGEVNFFNPLKIEPVLDLDLETQARGVTVNIAATGTIDKLNVSYRSDPPLQSNEIIALLAVGRAPDNTSGLAGSQITAQSSVFSTGANTILGQAISPVSNRLQRFFGVTHIKIDPQLQGIENVPQARLTLEQQISREITITYVTNLSRTSEQIFRFEWALSREYSLVAIRDENGLFGVDLQYKKRFK